MPAKKLLILILASLLWVGCGKKSEQPPPESDEPVAESTDRPSAAPVDIPVDEAPSAEAQQADTGTADEEQGDGEKKQSQDSEPEPDTGAAPPE